MGSQYELTTVIDNFFPAFNAKVKLPAHKLRVLDALQKCRTEYMGGHIEACEVCGEVRVPAGALVSNGKWKHSRAKGKYLFKVEQLSSVFSARFVKQLRKQILT